MRNENSRPAARQLGVLLASVALFACQDAIVVGRTASWGADNASAGASGSSSASAGASGSSNALGLWGEYWDNTDLAGPASYSRMDAILDTVWEDSPAPGISEIFSARWRGYLVPLATERLELTLMSDDGARLWIGENLLIDQWKGPSTGTTTVDVRADAPVELRVELYSVGGNASLRLLWTSPSTPTQPVPGDRFRLP